MAGAAGRRPASRWPSRPAPRLPPLDPEAISADFPILDQEVHGHRAGLPRLGGARRRSPRVVLEALDAYYRQDNANVHRGIYALSERATAAYEGARVKVARLINAPDPHDDHLDPQRDRVDQPRRVQLGPQAHRARRRDRADRDGAPREPRPVADPGPGEGRGPRVHPDHRRRDPAPGRVRRPAPAQAQAGRVHPRQQHAGHDQPGRGDDPQGPRGRRAGPHRRRPGRAPPQGRRPGHRLRLLRVQRPQDARPDGLRRAVGPARAARGDAPVHGRRRHDPRGPPAPERVERDPLEVRGGDAGHRGPDRAGRRGGLPHGPRDGPGARARARARRVRARGAPARGARASSCTAPARTCAAA